MRTKVKPSHIDVICPCGMHYHRVTLKYSGNQQTYYVAQSVDAVAEDNCCISCGTNLSRITQSERMSKAMREFWSTRVDDIPAGKTLSQVLSSRF